MKGSFGILLCFLLLSCQYNKKSELHKGGNDSRLLKSTQNISHSENDDSINQIDSIEGIVDTFIDYNNNLGTLRTKHKDSQRDWINVNKSFLMLNDQQIYGKKIRIYFTIQLDTTTEEAFTYNQLESLIVLDH